MSGFIFFFFSAAVALVQVKGQRSQLRVKGGMVGEVRRAHRGVFVRHSHPPSPLLVGGTVMAASLQASVLPVYWLFYTVKSNKTELLSYNHLRT